MVVRMNYHYYRNAYILLLRHLRRSIDPIAEHFAYIKIDRVLEYLEARMEQFDR